METVSSHRDVRVLFKIAKKELGRKKMFFGLVVLRLNVGW